MVCYSWAPTRFAARCTSKRRKPSVITDMPYDTKAMATKSITASTPNVPGIHNTARPTMMTMAE